MPKQVGKNAQALHAHDRRVASMLADPECVGELLLVGIAMARSLDLNDPGWVNDRMPMKTIAERIYGRHWLPAYLLYPGRNRADTNPWRRLRDVFRHDRRRYEPAARPGYDSGTCGRPMIRRDGLCGRNATTWRTMTDPTNGHRTRIGACSQKPCKQWLTDLHSRNQAELDTNPPPEPAANTGGVLERHLPEIDWWKVWRAVDPTWSPPPEGRAFERPRLTLLIGDGSDCDDAQPEPPVAGRPQLTVVEGGWR